MTRLTVWLGELSSAADGALKAEQDFRADFNRRVAELADRRAEAFRRSNLLLAVADGVRSAEDDENAVARGLAVLRLRLGWVSDSEARSEIMLRFTPVCAACFAASAEPVEGDEPPPEPATELAAFEDWYLDAKGTSFWILFENEIQDTPLVDF